jgi:uncharacterized protein YjcR
MQEIKEKAYEYYAMGLNSKEIGKLLDLSFRTVQNYMSAESWKEKREAYQARERKKIIKEYEKELRK